MRIEQVSLRKLKGEDEARLRSLVERCPDATVFHSVQWLSFVTDHFGADVQVLLATEDDVARGMMPYFVTADGLRSGGFCYGTVYGGPIAAGDGPGTTRTLTSLLSAFGRKRAGSRALHTYPGFPSVLLSRARYRTATILTSILDLTQPEERMWVQTEGRFRTAVRKASRTGVQVAEGNDEQLEWFAGRLAALSSGNGFSVFPGDLGEALGKLRAVPGLVRFTVGAVDGANAAGMLLLCFAKTVYFFAAAYDGSYRSCSPNVALQWDAIVWAKAAGFHNYDLLVVHDPGPAYFKRQLQGELVTFPTGSGMSCARWAARCLVAKARPLSVHLGPLHRLVGREQQPVRG